MPDEVTGQRRSFILLAMSCNTSGCLKKGVMMSTGNGNTTVEFSSAPNSNSVCK